MRRWLAVTTAAVAVILLAGAVFQAPSIAAGALLHPARRTVTVPAPAGCEDVYLRGAGVRLKGWFCHAATRRGTVVFLHGIGDNRGGAAGVVGRFAALGFDVVAYDSRAHGESEGEACTYGFREKADLRRVLDALAPGPVVAVGASLGGAVALQAAAEDTRIRTVVAAEVFSDLTTVARERAPAILPDVLIEKALRIAETRGSFAVGQISPAAAATHIRVPVLLIHGDRDTATPPAHSQRIYANLKGPRRLVLVAGAGHNESLSGAAIWNEIEQWVVHSVEAQHVNRAPLAPRDGNLRIARRSSYDAGSKRYPMSRMVWM